ncbi:MAG: 2Fe-2S iron-sulfur cluster-binding protein [Thermoleophilia bacterium]
MRLGAQPGELLDRSTRISFQYDGETVEAFAGDTIASALFAHGRRVFGRSFKYHRPRGLLCCSGHCPNCMMVVDGVPNVRTCVEPVRDGAVVKGQNFRGSLDRDLLQITDWIGGPFTPPGFYYKTFIRPRRLWPVYEKLLRGLAGLGPLPEGLSSDPADYADDRYDVEHRTVETLVIGGGRSGLEAAIAAAAGGGRVAVVDEAPRAGGSLLLSRATMGEADALVARARAAGVDVLAPARAIGLYEGNLVPVVQGRTMLRYRAGAVVVASGTMDQPLVFPGNDLVGVMFASAVRRLVNWWSLRPGTRAVVLTADDQGHEAAGELAAAGVTVARVVDLRERPTAQFRAKGHRGRVYAVEIAGEQVDCDLVVMSGSPQPAYALLAQAGATIEYDERRGVLVPTSLPDGVQAVGAAAGEVGEPAVPAATCGSGGDKSFVCFCEDQGAKDLKLAIGEGFDSIELSKRYTTVTMGPCQGKLCHLNSIRVYAKETSASEISVGTTTARPPWAPVTLGMLAGRGHTPAKRTSIHHRHRAAGAEVIWTGQWRRPLHYGDPAGEVAAVHQGVGLIDVSTLGKILVGGPDAVEFLERIYPNRYADLKVGRVRYGVLTNDNGRIFDDGTVVRLADAAFYVTTTSTGAAHVLHWFEWWNEIWQLDVEIADVTAANAAVNVAGPRSRELMERLVDAEADVSNEGFKYLDARLMRVAGVPCLAIRIGFVGELGYELHFPSPHGPHVWDELLAKGADLGIRPFGLEPQRVLRLEKGHVIIGQDTDAESTLPEASMSWLLKYEKEDFVGRWAAELVQERGEKARLVGFEMVGDVLPLEGAQIVEGGRSVGRITSVRRSAAVGKVIGLCWVPAAAAREGVEFDVKVGDGVERGVVRLKPFYDPTGGRLRA